MDLENFNTLTIAYTSREDGVSTNHTQTIKNIECIHDLLPVFHELLFIAGFRLAREVVVVMSDGENTVEHSSDDEFFV